jgi:hypothetical protein
MLPLVVGRRLVFGRMSGSFFLSSSYELLRNQLAAGGAAQLPDFLHPVSAALLSPCPPKEGRCSLACLVIIQVSSDLVYYFRS